MVLNGKAKASNKSPHAFLEDGGKNQLA